jgi:hypothetical protein
VLDRGVAMSIMTPEQKLKAIEQVLKDSLEGSERFPFSIIRAQFTQTIIDEIQLKINDETYAHRSFWYPVAGLQHV